MSFPPFGPNGSGPRPGIPGYGPGGPPPYNRFPPPGGPPPPGPMPMMGGGPAPYPQNPPYPGGGPPHGNPIHPTAAGMDNNTINYPPPHQLGNNNNNNIHTQNYHPQQHPQHHHQHTSEMYRQTNYLRGSLADRDAQSRIARQFFRYADRDGNGTLDPREFHNILFTMGFDLSPVDSERLFRGVDASRDGVLSEAEFVSWYVQYVARPTNTPGHPYHQSYPSSTASQHIGQDQFANTNTGGVYADIPNLRRIARAMFYEADRNRSGHLNFHEFWAILQRLRVPMTSDDARLLFSRSDLSRDGKISPSEFERIYIEICTRDNRLYFD